MLEGAREAGDGDGGARRRRRLLRSPLERRAAAGAAGLSLGSPGGKQPARGNSESRKTTADGGAGRTDAVPHFLYASVTAGWSFSRGQRDKDVRDSSGCRFYNGLMSLASTHPTLGGLELGGNLHTYSRVCQIQAHGVHSLELLLAIG